MIKQQQLVEKAVQLLETSRYCILMDPKFFDEMEPPEVFARLSAILFGNFFRFARLGEAHKTARVALVEEMLKICDKITKEVD